MGAHNPGDIAAEIAEIEEKAEAAAPFSPLSPLPPLTRGQGEEMPAKFAARHSNDTHLTGVSRVLTPDPSPLSPYELPSPLHTRTASSRECTLSFLKIW